MEKLPQILILISVVFVLSASCDIVHMPEEKQLTAEILFKLGRVDESVKKLHEALNLTDNQNDYNRINRLIETYQRN